MCAFLIAMIQFGRIQLIESVDENLRNEIALDATDSPISLTYIWGRILRMNVYKGDKGRRQFTARANLMYYGLKSYTSTRISDELFTRYNACGRSTCLAKPGQPCRKNANGDLADKAHPERKKLKWGEPDQIRQERMRCRKKWRRMQKAMIRALIMSGE